MLHYKGSVTNNRLQIICAEHPYDLTKLLYNMVQKELLKVEGYGKGKKYYINSDYRVYITKENLDFSDDEKKVYYYIKEKGYITTKLCKDELGYTKYKSISILNALLDNKAIVKIGTGKNTKYEVNQTNQSNE